MLGFKGRTDRWMFVAGFIGLGMSGSLVKAAVEPSIPWLFATFSKSVALPLAIVWSALVCAWVLFSVWVFWVLMVRRVRDMGWSPAYALCAWIGLWLATVTVLKPAMPQAVIGAVVNLEMIVWFGLLAFWPGRRGDRIDRSAGAIDMRAMLSR